MTPAKNPLLEEAAPAKPRSLKRRTKPEKPVEFLDLTAPKTETDYSKLAKELSDSYQKEPMPNPLAAGFKPYRRLFIDTLTTDDEPTDDVCMFMAGGRVADEKRPQFVDFSQLYLTFACHG